MKEIKIIPIIILGLALCACGNANSENANKVDVSEGEKASLVLDTDKKDKADSKDEDVDIEQVTEKIEIGKDEYSADNDKTLGLRNMKLDSDKWILSEEQELLVSYFDHDYFSIHYDLLRRYPQIFEGTQVSGYGVVTKIISQTNDDYALLLGWEWLWDDYFDQPYAMFGNYDRLETDVKNETVLIKGKAIDRNYIEKDRCSFRGRYVGVETIEVDGISYTVPVINAHEETNEGFTASQIKTIAKTVFGDDITLSESRLQIPEFNIDDFLGYIVTLDNQTNAKFNKYSLSPYGGIISDASDDKPENIERYIEFAPDFNHFFLFSYDSSFENLTLEYYDNDYNIIWKREFENTTSAIYDYTQYNAYVVANGYLYIINMDTGEDSFEKSYVGSKIEIRKIENGILLFDKSRSDAIMMTDNQGKILWTSNLNQQLWDVKCIQFKENDVMVCEIESLKDEYVDEATEEEFYDWYFYQEYIQIDLNSGDVVLEVTSDYDFQ